MKALASFSYRPHSSFASLLRSILLPCLAIFFAFNIHFMSACQPPASSENTQETSQEDTLEKREESNAPEKKTEADASEPNPTEEIPEKPPTEEMEKAAESTPEEIISSEKIADKEMEPLPDATEGTTEKLADGGESTPEADPEMTSEMISENTPENTTENTPETIQKFSLQGWVVQALVTPLTGIEGVEVCLHQDPSVACVQSAQDGSYTLQGVPIGVDIEVTLTKASAGYVPLMIPLHLDSQSPFVVGGATFRVGIFTQTTAQQTAALLGAPAPDLTQKSLIVAQVHEEQQFLVPVTLASVAMTPTSGAGPFYLPDGVNPPNTTGDTGTAVFFNVDPGQDYDVTASHPQRPCHPERRTRKGNNTSRFTAHAGWAILTTWICNPFLP